MRNSLPWLTNHLPVPLNVTLWGVAPVGAITSVAGLLPVLVGRNFTLTVQLPPGARDVGQLFVCWYCVGFAPPNDTLDTENGRATDALELRTVTVLAVAVVVFTV